jgi:hypothetical protein
VEAVGWQADSLHSFRRWPVAENPEKNKCKHGKFKHGIFNAFLPADFPSAFESTTTFAIQCAGSQVVVSNSLQPKQQFLNKETHGSIFVLQDCHY